MFSIKFRHPDEDVIRKVNFNRPPRWSELCAKVGALYQLPTSEIGLSYLDADGDNITIFTDEELAEFYAQNRNVQQVKFDVVRLEPRAPSVAQVPDNFGMHGDISPEPVMLEEQDWTAPPRREGMLGSMPSEAGSLL